MAILVPIVVFLIVTGGIVSGFVYMSRVSWRRERERLQQRIDEVSFLATLPDTQESAIIKRAIEGPLPQLDRMFSRTERGLSYARLIEQAGVKVSVSAVMLLSVVIGLALGGLTYLFIKALWAPLLACAAGMLVPTLVLRYKRKARLHRFEEQFPEALDLLSRAIRAGHAFTTAMSMVVEEAPDPLSPEFKKTFDEQNYGLPLKEALANMTERVPLMDVRFFVTAVLIQRETGGNLAEILDNLAHVVRERFKILRQVRVYTAHGRLTGYVLLGLPAALAIALSVINPEHMALLFRERMGQMMLVGAIVMQTVGYLWIKKVIKIEV
jgi:tight adherence protein B